MARGGRFDFDSYDGKLPGVPTPGLHGRLSVASDGTYRIEFDGGGRLDGRFDRNPLQVDPASSDSCRVTIRDPSTPGNSASIRLISTSARDFTAYLQARSYDFTQAMQAGEQRAAAAAAAVAPLEGNHAAGEWWAGLASGPFGGSYHYMGSPNPDEYGNLAVSDAGITYAPAAQWGAPITIPWQGIRDLTFATESVSVVTFGRTFWLGDWAAAYPKVVPLAVVRITEGHLLWSFAKPASREDVVAEWQPLLTKFATRSPAATAPVAPPDVPSDRSAG
jgi:hypothetical protein